MPTHPSREEIAQLDTIDQILQSTGDAAYSVDGHGRLSGWNQPAERLLGHHKNSVVGQPCHEILQGTDIFGNRYCEAGCPLLIMARQRAPIRHFQMEVRTRDDERLRVLCFPLRVPDPRAGGFSLVHLLRPANTVVNPTFDEGSGAETRLTTREMTVLRLLAADHSTREIATALTISPSTVRKHIQNLFEKLDVHTRLSAVMRAVERRLL